MGTTQFSHQSSIQAEALGQFIGLGLNWTPGAGYQKTWRGDLSGGMVSDEHWGRIVNNLMREFIEAAVSDEGCIDRHKVTVNASVMGVQNGRIDSLPVPENSPYGQTSFFIRTTQQGTDKIGDMRRYYTGSDFTNKITEGLGGNTFYSGQSLGAEDRRHTILPNPNVMRFKSGDQEQYQIWLSQVWTKGCLFNATMIGGVIKGLEFACTQLQRPRQNVKLCDEQLKINDVYQ